MPVNLFLTDPQRLRPTCPDAEYASDYASDVDAIESACHKAGLVTFGDVYNFVMLYRQGHSRADVLAAIERRKLGAFA